MMNRNESKLYIECDDQCGVIKFVEYDNDGYINIDYYVSGHYESQKTAWDKIRHRFKYILYAILGKEFLLYEVVISPEKAKEIKDYFVRHEF